VTRAAILALAAALGLAAGCGGGGQKAGTSISMQGLRFHPATVTARVGKPVVWTNDDSVDHNVTATSGASFRTRAFGNGKTFRYVPTKPGTIRYVCTLHPGMEGVLTVTH
jgi:plastocyanin